MIELKILDERAKPLSPSTDYSAGYDLSAICDNPIDVPPLGVRMVYTGIAINMMSQATKMMACIFPRSGKGAKEGIVLANLTGIIDQDYHGELMIAVWNRNPDKYITIKHGDKIAQLVFMPILIPTIKEVDQFSVTTERGSGGFGSTG